MIGLSIRASSLNTLVLSSAWRTRSLRLSVVSTRGTEVSIPGEKARPAPAMTTAATDWSCCTASSASVRALRRSALKALSFLGRFNVSTRTEPLVSVINTSSSMSVSWQLPLPARRIGHAAVRLKPPYSCLSNICLNNDCRGIYIAGNEAALPRQDPDRPRLAELSRAAAAACLRRPLRAAVRAGRHHLPAVDDPDAALRRHGAPDVPRRRRDDAAGRPAREARPAQPAARHRRPAGRQSRPHRRGPRARRIAEKPRRRFPERRAGRLLQERSRDLAGAHDPHDRPDRSPARRPAGRADQEEGRP